MCSYILFVRFCFCFFVNVLESLDGAEGLKPIQNNSIVLSSVDCPHDYLQNQVMCLCPY